MEQFSITNNGNLLRRHKDTYYFQTPDGDLVREVTANEAEYLNCVCINAESDNLPKPITEFPIWKKLWTKTDSDYSKYRAGLSSNGGCYAFHTRMTYWAAVVNGVWKFRVSVMKTTSADFAYTDDGVFTDQHYTEYTTNSSPQEVCYWSGNSVNSNVVLEQISTECSVNDCVFSSEWICDQDNTETILKPSLSLIKGRVQRLKELGWKKETKKKKRNSTRR